MPITIEPIWPWPIVILTSLALMVLVIATYQRQLKSLPPWLARTLLGLKLAAVVVLIFAMLRPAVQKSETDESQFQMLVLADSSRSTNTTDMPSNVSRFNAIRSDIQKHQSKWKDWTSKIEVRVFDFSGGLAQFDPKLEQGTGDQTAFGKVLEDVLQETRDRPTLGVLVFSDGAHRAVPPLDQDPLTAARKLADAQIPVYGIGYGASSLSSAALDLGIEDLVVPEVVFERSRVPVKGKLRATGAAGRKVRVRVLIEDRTGRRLDESGELKPAPLTLQAKPVQEFEIKRDSEVIPIELSFAATMSGEVKIALQVEPVENEMLKGNNQRETIITVKQGGMNVAYFDLPRTEQRWLRAVNGADKIQLDFQEIRGGRFAPQTKIDPSWFQRGRYDVFIIGDVRADVFGPELLKQLATRLEDGASLLMTGGVQNFATGGYATSPIADWLPVELDPADARPAGTFNAGSQFMGPQKMIPTERGMKEYVMQLGPPDKSRALWLDLPPLKGATRLKPVNELIEPWAATPEGVPLLFATTIQRSRVAAFAGDTTYLWWTVGDKAELHQRFWRQLILWLAKKEADSDQPVWVKVAPRTFAPGSNVGVTFGARGLDGQPVDDAEYQIEVTRPDGQKSTIAPRKSADENSAEFVQTELPGDYWVRVSARRGGVSVGFDASTRFIVDARDLELDYPSADYDFLNELSAITGGQSVKPEEVGDLLDRLRESRTNLTRVQTIPLWDNWPLLLLFVCLMSAEWFLRKKRGMV
jgi:hypothetical protein